MATSAHCSLGGWTPGAAGTAGIMWETSYFLFVFAMFLKLLLKQSTQKGKDVRTRQRGRVHSVVDAPNVLELWTLTWLVFMLCGFCLGLKTGQH